MTIRIATRGSDLALWQANLVADALRDAGANVDVIPCTTRGDRETGALSEIGGQGLFTAEVDRALMSGDADVAVHSLKDLPVEMVEGFTLAAVLERGPVDDLLISRDGASLAELPSGGVVGTSSPRRAAYVRAARPDLRIVDLRGNVPTRARRVADGDLDATLLARAGVERLGLDLPVGEVLSPPDWLPAPGQGAIAVVARSDDAPTRALVASLDHADTRAAVSAERAVLAGIGGGCSLPLGVHASRSDDTWEIRATLFAPEGPDRLDEHGTGPEALELARRLAQALISRGARNLRPSTPS